MNKTVSYYWFITFLSLMCNLKHAFSEESIPLHSNFKGKYTSDIKNYEIVVPQRVNEDGSFISHLVSHHHSKRSTKDMEFIFYKIPIGGQDYLIELTPNRKLISPGAVVEIHKENARMAEERAFSNETAHNETIGEMFRNLDIRKLKNTECHFSGTVKGENISKAALSTCYGLAGFIQITKGFYTIEPVAEHDPFVEGAYPHILYKTDGVENSSVCQTMGELTSSLVDQLVRKRRESNLGYSLPLYVETLIVMDKALINHHQGSDCENYVLTVFNMAFNLFRDASSGLMMTLTIVRIIRLEVENDEMNLKVNADAEKTLRYFQTWQYEINPGDDSHPNHHDIAVLITRVNVCDSPSSCGLLGLTTIGKGCDPKLSAALCEDNGLRLGYVIAHEIGHLLGADHDSENSTCNGTDANGLKTVMHRLVPSTAQTWSTCSQAYFKAFFSSGLGSCFFDEPEEHHFNVQDLLPGVMYNADFQCKHLIAMNARECDMGSTCDSLNCYVPGYACILTHKPPADGTRCGENMWCRGTKCLVVGERPGAVDGSWGEWSAWSDCSRTCGSGVASSERNCDRPQPSHGGKNCVGERKRFKICAATVISCIGNILNRVVSLKVGTDEDLIRLISEEVNVSFVGKPCETGRPSFRDIQCGEFNDWIYPEDGRVHTWKAFFSHDDNPCILYCINEEKQVAALRPRVIDGTMCYRGIRDVCVAGICRLSFCSAAESRGTLKHFDKTTPIICGNGTKSLPCDLHFESNAVEDACGICHGDGTGCEFSGGMETFSKLPKGVTKLVNVPSGSRNIKVEEMSPTLAKIIVRDKDTRDIYVRGKSLGMFNVPGSQAWLGMVKKNQEALNIPGPVTKPLSIWIHRLDNVTVKWSLALPAEQQRKPEFAWDFLIWGPCSAKCGPGTQMSKPSCMEGKAGLVEDTFCNDLEAPPTKVRQCQVAKCEARWMVGDWKGCGPTSGKKERKRVVYCIKPIGEGEGESQIVPDGECIGPKPHETEPCENRQKREDSERDMERDLGADSSFKSDTSEFGFHKKYEDYLKHFAALPVPQRNSETIPLYLVSSPHFKHYFHVLETPDDSETGSDAVVDVISPNGTTCDAEAQSKVSPDFYKETFSGQQIGVSHIQAASQEQIENRTKKSVNWDSGPEGRRILKIESPLTRSKSVGKSARKISEPKNSFLRRTRFRRLPGDSLKSTRSIIRKLFLGKSKKNLNRAPLNLTKAIETLNEREKSKFADLMAAGRRMSSFDRAKLRDYEVRAFKPKMFSGKRSFFSLFSKNKSKSKSAYLPFGERPLRGLTEKFDGSGLRKVPQTDDTPKEDFVKKARENLKENQGFYGNPFDPESNRRFDRRHSWKGSVDKVELAIPAAPTVSTIPSLPATPAMVPSKASESGNKTSEREETRMLVELHRVHKRKSSSRIWKKPKSKDPNSKPQNGNPCGTETRNYLNNLFRDNHQKTSTRPAPAKNQDEIKLKRNKPEIKEGVLVIDRDRPEDQEMEVMFDEDEDATGKRDKYRKLPRPTGSQKRLTLRGRDAFDLVQELRRHAPPEASPEAPLRFRNGSQDKSEVDMRNQKNGTTTAEPNSTTSSPDSSAETARPTTEESDKSSEPNLEKEEEGSDFLSQPSMYSKDDCELDLEMEEGMGEPKSTTETSERKKKEEEDGKEKKGLLEDTDSREERSSSLRRRKIKSHHAASVDPDYTSIRL